MIYTEKLNKKISNFTYLLSNFYDKIPKNKGAII